jgi:hypothetical protein
MLPEQAARTPGTVTQGFEDGLGRRYSPGTRGDGEAPPEIVCFRHEITDVPSFNFALRERVSRLSGFRHPYYVRILKVDRLNDERGTVALMSEGAPGVRLIEILTDVERGGVVLNLHAALYLTRQLLSAIEVLHEQTRIGHGAVAPERLFVTPRGRLCCVEYVLGAALEQLKYSRERYWKELRVALPAAVGLPRFDERADLTQIGVVALSLMLARPLNDDEYPARIEDLIASAHWRKADGSREPLPSTFKEWLRRTLQLDARHSFRTVHDAQMVFDQLLAENPEYSADAEALESFVKRYLASPRPAAPSPAKPTLVPESILRIEPASLELPAFEPRSAAEEDAVEDKEMKPRRTGSPVFGRFKWAAVAVVVVGAAGGGIFAARHRFAPSAPAVTTGTMTVNTNPPGAQVEVDGTARGLTPISLSLAAGAHTLVVRGNNGEPRTIPITIAAGAQVSQYIELPAAASVVGQLQVATDPAGASLIVDGVRRGKTPMTLLDLVPGPHTVTVESDLGTVTQRVNVEAGILASLVVPLAAPAAVASGWVSVTAPVQLELYEKGRLLGNSGIDRLMLPTGKHELELVNELLMYREVRTVTVSPGRVTSLTVTMPKGTLSINAVPWASVVIDGESIGDTPIGNFPITIGPHEVVFRNPQLGEQRRVVTVTQQAPVRLSIDMTKR